MVFMTAIAVLVSDIILGKKKSPILSYATFAGLFMAFYLSIPEFAYEGTAFGVFQVDNLTIFARLIIIISALAVALISEPTKNIKENRGEFLSLMLFATTGALVLSGAREMITFYVGLELLTIPSFILVALNKKDHKGGEGAIKYFILGVLASALLIYGISIVYGFTGQTDFIKIAKALTHTKPLLLLATIMIIGAVSFKITAVPFHFWAPDAYEGANPPIAGFIATVSKVAAFTLIIRLFATGLYATKPNWLLWFGIISAVTMTIGNLSALTQTNIKRMLAFSGVAHAGYMLIGIAIGTAAGFYSTLFYLATYVAATSGAFFVITILSEKQKASSISDFAGLSKKNPILAFLMACFLMSLIGLPPFAGFIGKVYLFGEAIKQGVLWLALIGVVNSVISFGYYSKVLKQMYMVDPKDEKSAEIFPSSAVALSISIAAVFLLVIFQTPVLNLLKGIGF